MITVLGKYRDTRHYENLDGYNVLSGKASVKEIKQWLTEAWNRGDRILLVSRFANDGYEIELKHLLKLMTKGETQTEEKHPGCYGGHCC